ncbi:MULTISPECIES: transcription elongation factor GreB [Thalassospira]|uniref:transcription elongation factor GreB n=1 Tax=Thalassospira TaxID=168934 RepID=UPI001FFD390E|nr:MULTISPECIES: transcription elongation factor GreB [Thalassospira]MDM7977361.1 transcription elongation factor GreB [Thalassospira xiamenensis]|tara:strand:+ start:1394 stop:1876 length:483 start_codon:yes stop_codon:yes gene_type:complete
MDRPIYMTLEGLAALRTELDHLWKKERPETVAVVSWAAGNGDRSENGDYIYGKKRLREIDRRVRYLRKRIEDAVVVEPHEQPDHSRVFFGATVTYVNARDEEVTIRIVGEDEAESLKGRISWISPVARALMKAGVGDVVTLRTPAGEDELEVLKISYPTA